MHFEIVKDTKDPYFGIGNTGLAAIDIAHLLIGNCDIKFYETFHDVASFKQFTQTIGTSFKALQSHKTRISRLLYDTDRVPLARLKHKIQTLKSRNQQFYNIVRDELTCSLIYKHRKLEILSFLHAYRIIEQIAVAAPLIYSAQFTDFVKTGKFLSDVSDGKKGELGVLKAVINRFLNDGMLLASSFSVEFRGMDNAYAKKYYNHFKKLHSGGNHLVWNDVDSSVDIPAIHYLDVIITSRNKMFHHVQNSGNAEVSESASLCAIADALMPTLLEWTTELLVKLIVWDLDRGH